MGWQARDYLCAYPRDGGTGGGGGGGVRVRLRHLWVFITIENASLAHLISTVLARKKLRGGWF